MSPDEVRAPIPRIGTVRVWCERCFYHWQGGALLFGKAVAQAHARVNPGHLVELTVRFLQEEERAA